MNLLELEQSIKAYNSYLAKYFIELNQTNFYDIETIEKNLAQFIFFKESLDNISEQTYLLISKLTDISNILRLNNKKDNFITFTQKHQTINNIQETPKIKKIHFFGVDGQFTEAKRIQNNSSIYWFNGDTNCAEGLYISILPNLVAQIPFPDLTTKECKNFKAMSSVCKYGTRDVCSKKHFNNKTNYDKICSFVHKGEIFKKVGSESRCPVSSLGCHLTFKEDIRKSSIQDIRILLMNALSDLLIVILWFQENNINDPIILTDLDKLQ